MKKIIMIGLPETGKTTFLAAFWHIVESSSCDLQLNKLPSQSEYIHSISKKWISCEHMGRTVLAMEKTVDLNLKLSDTNEIFNLVLPDLSGERFESHFNDRQWENEYADLISDSHGILLFIHPNKIEAPILINQVVPGACDDTITEGEGPAETVDWDSNLAPTQVKLVDILQFHIDHSIKSIHKIAVIISAWDCITTQNILPSEWIKKRLPLLDQFLKANNDHILHKIFGVSAQGGDIDENKKTLLEKINPIERIIVKDENNISNDLSSPLIWLLGD